MQGPYKRYLKSKPLLSSVMVPEGTWLSLGLKRKIYILAFGYNKINEDIEALVKHNNSETLCSGGI